LNETTNIYHTKLTVKEEICIMNITIKKISDFYDRFCNDFNLTIEMKNNGTSITAKKDNKTYYKEFNNENSEENIFINWLEKIQ